MGNTFKRKVAESQAITLIKRQFAQAMNDLAMHLQGYLEQIGTQLGAVMVVQQALLDLAEERQPGSQARVTELVEAARARYKAEQEAKTKAAEEAARARAEAESAMPSNVKDAINNLAETIANTPVEAQGIPGADQETIQ